jgi:phage terminase large subunit-like protein
VVRAPFVSLDKWNACATPVADLRGIPVYAGLDLSSVADLTALVLIGKIGDVWHVQPTFWLPAEGLREKSQHDHVSYDLWHQQGYLQTTPGATVSYEYVASIRSVFDSTTCKSLPDDWGMARCGVAEPAFPKRA